MTYRATIACSLTLRHVTEDRYVKYPVQNSWRYESIVLTNRIAEKRINIKKIKLVTIWSDGLSFMTLPIDTEFIYEPPHDKTNT